MRWYSYCRWVGVPVSKGGGPETKIGQNGKPIKGSPSPTSTQQSVIDANKSTIRKAVKKMQRYHDYQRNQ